ncbi:MAG TPA: aldo/keto reductase [Meiothermus sp.]|nr:aldo/keto reductase [Meiothermus sp.]
MATQTQTLIQFKGLPPIPPLGIGTWQWGDTWVWGYGKGYQESDIQAAFRVSLEHGVRLVDTAEVYGLSRAERMLGKFLKNVPEKPLVVSKFFPLPWRLSRKFLIRALKSSLKRLQLEQLDLYLQHWPWPPLPVEAWAESLAEAYELGLTRAVGVSNFNPEQLERSLAVLSKHNVPLAANQVEYHLLERTPEKTGLKALMEREGIVLMAYSPLAMGWLTGKYSLEHPPQGGYRDRYKNRPQISALLEVLKQIAASKNATPAQIALRWCIERGALPIPGAKNAQQAAANAGALAFTLSAEEVARLDQVSA